MPETAIAPHPLVGLFTYFTERITDQHGVQTYPWSLTHCGEPWVYATDGHMVVAHQGAVVGASCGPVDIQTHVRRWLSEPLTNPLATTFAAVSAFAGDVTLPGEEVCDACDGTGVAAFSGEITCEHCGEPTRQPCAECDGMKCVEGVCPMRVGAFDPAIPFNCALLAYGLSLVPPCNKVTVGHIQVGIPRSCGEAVVVDGETWRVIVMRILPNRSRTVQAFRKDQS